MNESKRTKGPWLGWEYLDGRHVRIVTDAGDVFTAALTAIDGFPYIDISEADARLIAAALDLLNACRRALHLVEDEDNNRLIVEMPGSFGLLLDLQNAIAKAESR